MHSQSTTNVNATLEHRRCPRRNVLFASAEFEKGNGGIVLNLSEDGLALHATSQILSDELPDLRFQISVADPWIETKGRIVWRSHSKRTVGVQFLDLADSSRQIIRNWISQTNDGVGSEELPVAEDLNVNQNSPITQVSGQSIVSPARDQHTSRLPAAAKVPFENFANANASAPIRSHKLVYEAVGLLVLVFTGYLLLRNPDTHQKTNGISNAITLPSNDSSGTKSSNVAHPGLSTSPALQRHASSEPTTSRSWWRAERNWVYFAQFWTDNPAIRLNSRSLFVASVTSKASTTNWLS